jgi:Sulfatase
MGDDVGWFNIGVYHRGIMSGKTPNLDKLADEGMMFTDYYADRAARRGGRISSPASCRSARVSPPSARHTRRVKRMMAFSGLISTAG